MKQITQEMLKKNLYWHEPSQAFYWAVCQGNNKVPNDKAGTDIVVDGIAYRYIRFRGHMYNVEHLKHLWFTGKWPKKKLRVRGVIPFRGVSYVKDTGKYRAQCYRNGVRKYLGSFDAAIDASKAYEAHVTEIEKEESVKDHKEIECLQLNV